VTKFVNLDAAWLAELAAAFEGEPEQARLLLIAEHLQGMDEKLQNLSNAPGEFERGVRTERERIFGRTNLPLQGVEVSPELRDAILRSQAPVKKIKRGVSGFDQPKPVKTTKTISSPALKEILAGLKIDVSKIGVKG